MRLDSPRWSSSSTPRYGYSPPSYTLSPVPSTVPLTLLSTSPSTCSMLSALPSTLCLVPCNLSSHVSSRTYPNYHVVLSSSVPSPFFYFSYSSLFFASYSVITNILHDTRLHFHLFIMTTAATCYSPSQASGHGQANE